MVEEAPSQYTVELRLTGRYLASSENGERRLHLGFHLMKGTSLLGKGEVPCILRTSEPNPRLKLNNMNHVSAEEIQLYVAH